MSFTDRHSHSVHNSPWASSFTGIRFLGGPSIGYRRLSLQESPKTISRRGASLQALFNSCLTSAVGRYQTRYRILQKQTATALGLRPSILIGLRLKRYKIEGETTMALWTRSCKPYIQDARGTSSSACASRAVFVYRHSMRHLE